MSEETRRIELAADYFIDTISDLIPYENTSGTIRNMIKQAASFAGQSVAWPTYEYHWKGPYPWKHGPEKNLEKDER